MSCAKKGSGGNSHQRAKERTKAPVVENVRPPVVLVPPPANHLGLGDSFTVLALFVGVYLVLIVPTVILKAILLAPACVGFAYLVRKSYWTHAWPDRWRTVLGIGLAVILCAFAVPQFISQWHLEHPRWKDINHGTRFVVELISADAKKNSPATEAVLFLENNDPDSLDHHVYFTVTSPRPFADVVIDNPARVQQVIGGPNTKAPFVSGILEFNAPELGPGERQLIRVNLSQPVEPKDIGAGMRSDNCPKGCSNVAIFPPYYIESVQPAPKDRPAQ